MVAGVVIGGFAAGVASVAAGFLVYDYGFIPPYDGLKVGHAQNWVALAVYAVVMVLVSKVVAKLDGARSEAQRRTVEAQRLFDLSQLLVEDRSVEDLLKTIVGAVRSVFGVPGVALLVPRTGGWTSPPPPAKRSPARSFTGSSHCPGFPSASAPARPDRPARNRRNGYARWR